MNVTDFRRKYESRVKRVRSAADRVRLVGDLSEDFERLVRSQPYITHCRTMQVHHITYERLGHENAYTDLVTVCGSCHKKLHNYYNRRRTA